MNFLTKDPKLKKKLFFGGGGRGCGVGGRGCGRRWRGRGV